MVTTLVAAPVVDHQGVYTVVCDLCGPEFQALQPTTDVQDVADALAAHKRHHFDATMAWENYRDALHTQGGMDVETPPCFVRIIEVDRRPLRQVRCTAQQCRTLNGPWATEKAKAIDLMAAHRRAHEARGRFMALPCKADDAGIPLLRAIERGFAGWTRRPALRP